MSSSTGMGPEVKTWVERKVRSEFENLTKDVEVNFFQPPPKDLNEIRRIIAVMSGNGGTRKSLVTDLLAISFNLRLICYTPVGYYIQWKNPL